MAANPVPSGSSNSSSKPGSSSDTARVADLLREFKNFKESMYKNKTAALEKAGLEFLLFCAAKRAVSDMFKEQSASRRHSMENKSLRIQLRFQRYRKTLKKVIIKSRYTNKKIIRQRLAKGKCTESGKEAKQQSIK